MSCINLIILPLGFIVVFLRSTRSQHTTIIGDRTIKIGESCERDIQCIRSSFCRYQMTCMCDEFFAPSLDKASCHVTSGASCFQPEGCSTMANAECRQNVCTCKDNFMIDLNNSSNCIIRPTRTGDLCQRNDDCKDSMEMAHCIDSKCRCYTAHRFVNETGTCLKTRGLYQPCKKDHECFLDEKNPHSLECRNGECACREGESGCSKGTRMNRPIFIIPVTIIIFTTLFGMST